MLRRNFVKSTLGLAGAAIAAGDAFATAPMAKTSLSSNMLPTSGCSRTAPERT